jgi:hypothetical protein
VQDVGRVKTQQNLLEITLFMMFSTQDSREYSIKSFPTSLEILKHLALFPHKRGKGDKNIHRKHIRNVQHKN